MLENVDALQFSSRYTSMVDADVRRMLSPIIVSSAMRADTLASPRSDAGESPVVSTCALAEVPIETARRVKLL